MQQFDRHFENLQSKFRANTEAKYREIANRFGNICRESGIFRKVLLGVPAGQLQLQLLPACSEGASVR